MSDWDWQIWTAYTQGVQPLRPISRVVEHEKTRSALNPLSPPELPTRLDLHGLSLSEAFEQFCHTIERVAPHQRQLLVITGLGQGLLKRELPFWAQHPRVSRWIRSCTQAPPHLGGHGAFIVALRK